MFIKQLKNIISRIYNNRVLVIFIVLLSYLGILLFDFRLPIAVLFGPILLFVISSRRINFSRFLLHFTPFLIFLFYKLYLVYLIASFKEYENIYYILYDSVSVLSIFAYMYYIIGAKRTQGFSWFKKFYIRQLYFSYIIMMGIFIVLLYRRIVTPEESITGVLSTILAVLVLMLIVSLIYVVINNLERNKLRLHKNDLLANRQARYGLETQDLEKYAQKIKEFFSTSDIYLDVNFNLDRLSSHLQIPKHHLSVCINNYFGKNFYTLLASYRIKEAIKLAQNNSIYTWEAIAFECGYSSRSTFNKHFKEITGCLPSEFSKESSSRLYI